MSAAEKFCKDCRHADGVGIVPPTCARTAIRQGPEPVYGQYAVSERLCVNERCTTDPSRCGPEAQFFEPRRTWRTLWIRRALK